MFGTGGGAVNGRGRPPALGVSLGDRTGEPGVTGRWRVRPAGYGDAVNGRGARIALLVVGAIAVVVGGVWVGQGLNVIPGSFMTGSRMWLAIGLVVAVVGIVLIARGLRRRPQRGAGR